MKSNKVSIGIGIATLALSTAIFAAPNPVSYDQMVKYVNAHTSTLTAADWTALCASGSPADSTGCYGNVNSTAFTKVNQGTGGFLTYANINPANAPAGSLFVKAFYAGTNLPTAGNAIALSILATNVARCGLYIQQGTGVDSGGPSMNNSTVGEGLVFTGPVVVGHPVTVTYASPFSYPVYPSEATGTFAPPQPLYMVCAGVNVSDGLTSESILNVITAG